MRFEPHAPTLLAERRVRRCLSGSTVVEAAGGRLL
jgi:hypothetical protein